MTNIYNFSFNLSETDKLEYSWALSQKWLQSTNRYIFPVRVYIVPLRAKTILFPGKFIDFIQYIVHLTYYSLTRHSSIRIISFCQTNVWVASLHISSIPITSTGRKRVIFQNTGTFFYFGHKLTLVVSIYQIEK